jgi:hypothetical protein
MTPDYEQKKAIRLKPSRVIYANGAISPGTIIRLAVIAFGVFLLLAILIVVGVLWGLGTIGTATPGSSQSVAHSGQTQTLSRTARSSATLKATQGSDQSVIPTGTKKPAATSKPASTRIAGSTATPGCPGAPPQRVQVGERAKVCTRRDRLILRENPGFSSEELDRLDPGSVLKIINGPECKDGKSWWKVEPDFGWTAGWVCEGGDQADPYYICPAQ